MPAVRWFVFILYLSVFCVAPFWILFGIEGAIVSFVLMLGGLLVIKSRANRTLFRLFSIRPLSASEGPLLNSLSNEYCRRLNLAPAKLAYIDTPAINAAVFGFSTNNYTLVFTKGLIDSLGRENLSAVIAWLLTRVRMGQLGRETYLSVFLDSLGPMTQANQKKDIYSLRVFLRQFLFYPLLYFPYYWMTPISLSQVDKKALELHQNLDSLTSTLRLLESGRNRNRMAPPWCIRHLFMVPPPAADPLAELFFGAFPRLAS